MADEEFLCLMDEILKEESKDKKITKLSELKSVNGLYDNVFVWRGDITTLEVDGIVNAANSNMLGCFTVGHKCIDNVIHEFAGPRLRLACREVRDVPEESGDCKITKAFNLPSKYVLHTVGPIFDAKKDYESQAEVLRKCYLSCLECAEKNNLKSIAFCCISTGVFGYPQREAAMEAMNTVKKWIDENENSSLQTIVFNTFTKKDTDIYEELKSEIFSSTKQKEIAFKV